MIAFTTGERVNGIKDALKHIPLSDDLVKKNFHDLL